MLGGEVVLNADGQLQLATTLVGIDEQLDRKVAVLPGTDFVNSQDLELAAFEQSVETGRRHIVWTDLRVACSGQDRHTLFLGVFLLDPEALVVVRKPPGEAVESHRELPENRLGRVEM